MKRMRGEKERTGPAGPRGRNGAPSRGGAPAPYRALHVAVLLAAWLLSALYAWHYLDRGWWPNNAGAFALSAERVQGGELPHRDFAEIYTGGAAYLHALAFEVLGTNMASMRRALFLVFLTWIPAVYVIATRFVPPLVAGLATLLAAAWSLPIYSEPIASWYNLFFATHGLAALLRYLDTRHRRWLFAVGACGGLSLLAKIIGIYFVLAACLALLFHEQEERRVAPQLASQPDSRRLATAYSVLLCAGLAACVGALSLAMLKGAGPWGVVHFALPIAAVAAVVIHGEVIGSRDAPGARLAAQARLLWPVGLGVLITVLPFLAQYVVTGSLPDLLRGLFVDPQKRLSVTASAPPPLSWAALPMLLILAWPLRWPRVKASVLGAVLAVPALLIVENGKSAACYSAAIGAIRAIIPTAVVAGCVTLLVRRRHGSRIPSPDAVFAIVAVAGLCSLVQFPVAETIYIYFAAPLGLLAVLAVADMRSSAPRVIVVAATVTLLAFSVVWINRSIHFGWPHLRFQPDRQTYSLNIDRAGGIRVHKAHKLQYESLVKVVRLLARGEYIFATPDCAEVYFLSGFKNPTRTTYDFFDDPVARVEHIENALRAHDVNLVVLNKRPQYSQPPSAEFTAWLQREYPKTTEVGAFQVRWRP